ncbi:hypothetical protein PENSPDRAFT_689378 [Peniophora sp. CONT]|nr:hypothetical protein PENSPDRAFT_689378 [Peniophora sp. CONT]
MAAADPTYPLYPIACILAAAMLLLVLLTSFIRQSWNLGVASLCFWLFFANLTSGGINAIIWADNADIKLYVYCDIVQQLRFEVDEGFGCRSSTDGSVLEILLLESWAVCSPLVSVIFYYPKVARILYRQSRDIDSFFQSNNSVTRTNYVRILVLASIDIILTLPIGIVTIILFLTANIFSGFGSPLYRGWTYDHTDWEPESYSYENAVAQGTSFLAAEYFARWSNPILAFAIFGLFGVTSEARASYWRIICTFGGWFGWKPTPRTPRPRSPLGDIEFGERPMDLEIGSQPSYINPDARVQQGAGSPSEGERAAVESKSVLDMEITEEPREIISDSAAEPTQ